MDHDPQLPNDDRFQSVVDNIGIGISVISPEMRILSLNRQMRQWFPDIDLSRRPLCYASFNSPPRSDICPYCPTHKTLRDGRVHEEVTSTPRGDTTRNYRIIASPIHDAAGKITAAVEMVEDITDRIQAENELRRYQSELETMVAEKTGELRKTNLRLSAEIEERKKAEAALQQKMEQTRQFAYTISHDFKNPTVAMQGLCRLLYRRYRDVLDERGQECCRMIIRSAEQMVGLADRINQFISVDCARLRFEATDLRALFERLEAEYAARFRKRRIAWSMPPTLPVVKVDPLSLVRIVRNVLDNALKYGGEQMRRIFLEYQETGSHHILIIANDGRSLSQEEADRAFHLFHRRNESPFIEGAGLGLSIVRDLAERHGGCAWIDNGPQAGIRVHVSLAKQPGPAGC